VFVCLSVCLSQVSVLSKRLKRIKLVFDIENIWGLSYTGLQMNSGISKMTVYFPLKTFSQALNFADFSAFALTVASVVILVWPSKVYHTGRPRLLITRWPRKTDLAQFVCDITSMNQSLHQHCRSSAAETPVTLCHCPSNRSSSVTIISAFLAAAVIIIIIIIMTMQFCLYPASRCPYATKLRWAPGGCPSGMELDGTALS